MNDELRKEIIETRNKLNDLENKLDKLEYEDNRKKLEPYLGKCYINRDYGFVKCVIVTNLDDIKSHVPCLNTLHVRYDPNGNGYSTIEQDSYFSADDEGYIEITREEFIKHYNNALQILNNKLYE